MAAPVPPQWVIDLNSPPSKSKGGITLPDPPGYTATSITGKSKSSTKITLRTPPSEAETNTLLVKKAWEVAIAPLKQLPMTGIMMYMSGNSLQMFSIMMVGMAFKNPFMGLMATNQVFERYETEGTKSAIFLAKAAYVMCQFLALALGVWKVNGMGLLPTATSDWLAWETARQPLETAIPAF